MMPRKPLKKQENEFVIFHKLIKELLGLPFEWKTK